MVKLHTMKALLQIDKELLVDEKSRPTDLFWTLWRSADSTQKALKVAGFRPQKDEEGGVWYV